MRSSEIWEVNIGLKDILLKWVRLCMETYTGFFLLFSSSPSLSLSLSLKFQTRLKMRWQRKLNFRMSCPSFESVWITHIYLMVRQCPFFPHYFWLSFLWPTSQQNSSKDLPILTVYFPPFSPVNVLCWYYLMYCSYSDFFSCLLNIPYDFVFFFLFFF